MTTHLGTAEIEAFQRDGFLSPRRVFDEGEAANFRQKLAAIEASVPATERASARFSLPSIHAWAWDLVHDARIVDPVVDLLGENVLLWSMDWFIKQPGKTFVSYHQDATYWGLEPHDVLTAWIALSDASEPTGPMKFIPGTHRGPLFEQRDTYHEDNMLSRGQQILDVDESQAVLAPLTVGQMSLHHVRVIHGSDANRSPHPRIGMVLRYCATHVRQTKVAGDQAVLVHGVDEFGNFQLIPRPDEDRAADADDARQELGRVRRRALFEDL